MLKYNLPTKRQVGALPQALGSPMNQRVFNTANGVRAPDLKVVGLFSHIRKSGRGFIKLISKN